MVSTTSSFFMLNLKYFEVNCEVILEISDKVDSDINLTTGFSEFIILSIQYHSIHCQSLHCPILPNPLVRGAYGSQKEIIQDHG